MSKTVTCKKCGLYYKSIKNLRQHVLKHHPLLIDKIAPKKRILNQGTNKCNECPKSFVRSCDLRRHQRIKHSNILKHLRSLKSKIRCSICEFNCASQKLLMEHLQQSHDIILSIESKIFNNIEDLNEWRLLIENETNSKYIRACGSRTNLDGSKSIYYRCQRSGYYIPKGKGLRPLKSLGSRKLNGSCPASIRISISSDGRCKVCFVKTHVGHLTNMNCLSLSEQQLRLFASRIKTNIPLHAILDEVRDSLTESKLERLRLVSKEDMFRIRNSFTLTTINSTDEVVPDDGTNVDSWIQETIDTGASCVLFYKPKGAIFENYPELNTNDFLLIVMNSEQCEVLKRYGNDCICIDRTINLSANGLELVTVLVLDNVRQAFPCAFFITNRTDISSLTVFFQIIRQTTDTLSPKIFMSDREEAFYHAWLDVMNPPAIQLYCMWLIDAVWRSNLSKIEAMIKQIEVYKILRTLMNHENPETFEESLNIAIKILCDNSETSEFGFYFLTEHAPYYALWAKCYRVTSGIESNIQMERVHATLKYVFLNGKRVKRLDKAIHSLMVLVRDKLFKNLINTSHCEDIASKQLNINIHHEISLQLSEDLVMEEDKAWKVLGGSELQKNLVQELYPECQCSFQCHTCKVCIHRYVCTCMDSATRWNMCRHIHLVCRKRNILSLSQLCDNPTLIGDGSHITDVEELSVDPAEMEDVTSMDISLESRRTQLKDKLFSIADSISTSEELDILENCLTSMEESLAVARPQNEACGEMVLNNSPKASTFLLLPENKDPTQQTLLFQSYNEAGDVHDKNTTFQLVLLKASKNTATKFCN